MGNTIELKLPDALRSAEALIECAPYLASLTEEERLHLIVETFVADETQADGLDVHLAYPDFEAYLDDKLDEVDAEIVEGHLEMCALCSRQSLSMKLAVTPGRSNRFLDQYIRRLVPETPEVLHRYTGRITAIDAETASLQLWDAEAQKPYVVTYDATALAEQSLGVGDRVVCILQKHQGRTEMAFAPDISQSLSIEERERMRADAEAKYASFPNASVY